jgi:hypothetical protein
MHDGFPDRVTDIPVRMLTCAGMPPRVQVNSQYTFGSCQVRGNNLANESPEGEYPTWKRDVELW